MDSHVGQFFESVTSIFRGGDTLPVCDPDIIAGCEAEVADAGNEEQKNQSIMRLSWALVHSKQPEDVNRGIGMLEASLGKVNTSLETREKLYLLAVGRYRTGDYTRSREILERCLEIQPDWRQALTLQGLLENKTKRDGMIGMAIVTGAFGVVGLVAGGIITAASSSRSRRK